MAYLTYLFFGLAPSIIWLIYFIKKDEHPEDKRTIVKIFFYGMIIAAVAAIVEVGIADVISFFHEENLETSGWLTVFLYNFAGIALVEEFLKYFVVRWRVLKSSDFDEPVDVMIYMIVSALGFAALENILLLLPVGNPAPLMDTVTTAILRFLGATFLHALASGLLGYFVALAICRAKKRINLILLGLFISTFLHTLYNFSIIKISDDPIFAVLPVIILAVLAVSVSRAFKEVKKLPSTCKI